MDIDNENTISRLIAVKKQKLITVRVDHCEQTIANEHKYFNVAAQMICSLGSR